MSGDGQHAHDPTQGALDATRAGPLPAPAAAPEGSATWWSQDGPTARPQPAPRVFAPALGPGAVLGGDFEVLEPLGVGGMGAVYRARQVSLGRVVALKVLPPHEADRPESVERFLREARASAAVMHPNVITVFAAGRDEGTGHLFIAMELVPGGDAERLARQHGGRLPERRALEIARDVARGLTAIEAAGMFHRDIKPANILLTPDGTAKIADLGLARGLADRMTQTGAVVGTPAFMSPEQAEGRQSDLDIRTDIYALGATLYALVTGRRPYEAESVPKLLHLILEAPPPDPRAVDPSLSPALAAIVRRAMAKSRDARYPRAADLVADLERAIAALEPGAARAPGSRAPVVALGLLGAVVIGGALAAAAVVARTRAPAAVPDPAPSVTGPNAATEPRPAAAVAPAPAPEASEVASIVLAWHPKEGPLSNPDLVVTNRVGAVDHQRKLIMSERGSSFEARFVLPRAPRWARLLLAHEGRAIIDDDSYTFVDIEVNGRTLVARGDPNEEWTRTLDLTGIAREGENTLRVSLHPDSVTAYWLRRIEVRHGSGPPPD